MTEPVTRALQPIPLHGLLFDVAGASAQGPRAENQDAFDVDAFATRGPRGRGGRDGRRARRPPGRGHGPAHAGGGRRRSARWTRPATPCATRTRPWRGWPRRRRTAAGGWGAPWPSWRSRWTAPATRDGSARTWATSASSAARRTARCGWRRATTRRRTRAGRRARSPWTRSRTRPAPTGCSGPWAGAGRRRRAGSPSARAGRTC